MVYTTTKAPSWRRKVGERRQVAIPNELYESLGSPDYIEFLHKDGEIIIRGVTDNGNIQTKTKGDIDTSVAEG